MKTIRRFSSFLVIFVLGFATLGLTAGAAEEKAPRSDTDRAEARADAPRRHHDGPRESRSGKERGGKHRHAKQGRGDNKHHRHAHGKHENRFAKGPRHGEAKAHRHERGGRHERGEHRKHDDRKDVR